jgi:uncharacterized protein with PIN domain
MPSKQDYELDVSRKEEARIAELEEANARLKESLSRCRKLVADCHARLAANSDDEAADAVPSSRATS